MTSLVEDAPAAAAVVVARLPVVDRDRTIVGFELISRSTHDQGVDAPTADREAVVTGSSLLGSVDLNLSALVGDKLLFCTVDRDVLLGETRLSLPPRRTVLELQGDLDDELLGAVQEHRNAGFHVIVPHDAPAHLLTLADHVRVDLRTGSAAEIEAIEALVDEFAEKPVRLVAAGCDTEAELAWAQTVGFDLFLGRAVQGQEQASEDVTAPLPVSQLQLAMELLSEDLDLDRIEDVLRGDPALIVQLLSMASSGAGGGMRRQVRSLREALVVLGTVRLRQWAALVILSRHSSRAGDVLVTTLVRGRMCELLARNRGLDSPFAFTAGLLSALHILLGVQPDAVEQQLAVSEELTAAAFGRQGPVGALVTRVEQHEESLVTDAPTGPDHDEVTLIGAMAFGWAASYTEAMATAAPE